MPNRIKNQRAEALANSMNCARWLVGQFEEIDCPTIARLFQRAVDDADSWIQQMALGGSLPEEMAQPIKVREATIIHNLLVKYASIEDPDLRSRVLSDMMGSLDRKEHEQGGKGYANGS